MHIKRQAVTLKPALLCFLNLIFFLSHSPETTHLSREFICKHILIRFHISVSAASDEGGSVSARLSFDFNVLNILHSNLLHTLSDAVNVYPSDTCKNKTTNDFQYSNERESCTLTTLMHLFLLMKMCYGKLPFSGS